MKKVAFTLLVLVPVIGGLYWLLLDLVDGPQQNARIDIEPPDRRQQSERPAAAPAKTKAPITNNTEEATAATATPPPVKQPEVVNSYDLILAYRVDLWTTQEYPAGHIDSVRIDGKSPQPANIRRLRPDDVLSLHGWAGHPRFGVRMRNILFTLCDLVVGAAEISSARPDVATTVHQNLDRSGWSARLAVAHFPDCEKPVLGAWAIAPTGTLAWPLIGAMPLKLPPSPRQQTENYVSTVTPVMPEDADPPRIWTFSIRAKLVNLRQCGDTKCPIVGKIPTGPHKAFLSDRAGGWVLLQFSDATGWVAERLLTLQKDEAATQ